MNICAICREYRPVVLDGKRGALDSWDMQQHRGCLGFVLPCQECLDMLLLLLGELIGPCPHYLYPKIKSLVVFECNLIDTALDLSCQMISISGLLAGDLH